MFYFVGWCSVVRLESREMGSCNCGMMLGSREMRSWNCVVGLKHYRMELGNCRMVLAAGELRAEA